MDENNNFLNNDENEVSEPVQPEPIQPEPIPDFEITIEETSFSSENTDEGNSVPENTEGGYTNYQTYETPSNNATYENFQPYIPNNNAPSHMPYYQSTTPAKPKKEKSKKKGLVVILAIVIAVFVFAGGFVLASVLGDSGSENPSSGEDSTKVDGDVFITNEETPDSPAPTGEILNSVQIAEIGRASSVGVVVYSSNKNYFSQSSQSKAGEGTGIVAKIKGEYTYVITCAHVISDSGISAKILLEDGTTFDADIIGFDQHTDIGVLRVKTTSLTCAEFGDSSKLKVGSPVYAVGNPGGSEFFGSVTNGIVSSISRSINNEIGYTMDCIQHNAAINPGNSGGSLLNEYGQVIGVNSSKIASTEYEGMSFAIPISTALEVANTLISNGYVPDRPKLGITYSLASSHDTYAMIVQIKGLPAGSLVVRSISSDSALADSEVREGDMIIAVNGKDLDTADTLLDVIDKSKVGDSLKLTICRINTDYSTEEFEVTVKLVEDKGSSATPEEETTYINPFDYFDQFN